MSTVRNRRLGLSFVREFGQVVPEKSFEQTIPASPHEDAIKSILRDLPKRLPANLPHEQRTSFLKMMKEQIQSPEFTVLLQDEKVIASMHALSDAAQKMKNKMTDDATSLTSFFTTLGGTLARSVLSQHFPIAGLLLSALPLAMGSTTPAPVTTTTVPPVDWQIHEGIPEGGQDTCISVLLYGCLQGYLTKGDAPWSVGDPQFNRIIKEIHGDDSAISSTYTTLRDCLTIDVVGGVSKKVLAASANSPSSITCVATSPEWSNYTVTGQASGFAKDDCIAYQNTFSAAVLNCQDAWARAGRTAAIAGGVLGGLALCASIIALTAYCCNKSGRSNDCRPPCV